MNLDPQEEKLFMILQAIEQQGEQNKKTQANIEQLLKASQEQQSQLTKERVELNKGVTPEFGENSTIRNFVE